jgi:hypothetical protein
VLHHNRSRRAGRPASAGCGRRASGRLTEAAAEECSAGCSASCPTESRARRGSPTAGRAERARGGRRSRPTS